MTQVLVNHKVKDYDKWKEVFDNFAPTRRTGGEKSYRILRPSENPNDLTLLFEWDTPEHAQTFMKSTELKKAMERGGVAGEPTIQFLTEIDKGTL